jgi:hypothetical protein
VDQEQILDVGRRWLNKLFGRQCSLLDKHVASEFKFPDRKHVPLSDIGVIVW